MIVSRLGRTGLDSARGVARWAIPWVVACCSGLGLGCAKPVEPPVPEPRIVHPTGIYRHAYIQLEMPGQIGPFERIYVTEYDPDRANVSGHYEAADPYRGVATIYVYPANADAAPPDRAAFIGHFELMSAHVRRIHPLAKPIREGGAEMEVNGFTLQGAHASFLLPDHPAFDGPVDSHLYLFALDGWYLKFRFSHSEALAADLIPHEQRFIESITWPVPDDALP